MDGNIDEDDGLAFARGCVIGVAISLAVWTAVIVGLWWWLAR